MFKINININMNINIDKTISCLTYFVEKELAWCNKLRNLQPPN